MSETSKSDVVIIGGGHNVLVAATQLAKRRLKVTLCEKNDFFGGIAAGREFAPGFKHAGIWHHSSHVWPEVLDLLSGSK